VERFLLHLFSRQDLSAYLKSISLIMILMSSSIKSAIMGWDRHGEIDTRTCLGRLNCMCVSSAFSENE